MTVLTRFFFYKEMYGHFSGPNKSGRNNEVTVLPRLPQGGVPLYLGVFYIGLFSLKSCSLSVLANFLLDNNSV